MRILSNSAKFSATMGSTYSTHRLGAVASLKFLAIENMPPHFLAHVYYGQTAGWIRMPHGTAVVPGMSLHDSLASAQATLY